MDFKLTRRVITTAFALCLCYCVVMFMRWGFFSRDSDALNMHGNTPEIIEQPERPIVDSEKLHASYTAGKGEAHLYAVELLDFYARTQSRVNDEDMKDLLVFVSSPKPDGLSMGEWEERVNSLLNLLRKQHLQQVDGGEFGLTQVLLDMAAKNPSKVLRLYAMQHLSLWFPREADQEKRKQMVDLLENIAANQHDETAGCAVLMLADMRREAMGIGTLDVPKDVNGIDWKRVDQVIADASQQLVGEKAARADVRISAIHTCVDRKDGTALPAMRQIAEDVKLVSPLRKAAIYAIGQLGNSEDLTLLASLPQDDGNLSLAVLPAQKELELKFAQESLR